VLELTRRSPSAVVAVAVGFPLSALVALSVAGSSPRSLAVLALAPAVLLLGMVLVTSGNRVLLGIALAAPLFLTLGGRPLPVGGSNLYFADLLVLLAIGAWLFNSLLSRAAGVERRPLARSPVLGWPLAIFAALIVVATLRGNAAYGTGIVGQPLRLVLYAAIGLVLYGLTARSLHRLLVSVFYAGTFVTMGWAAYYIATGTSQTDQAALSTGGDRILGISTTIYLAGAFFLALLNLRVARSARDRMLHLGVAALAAVGVVLGYGRAVYVAVAIVTLLLLTVSRDLRWRLLGLAGLALPFLALGLVLLQLAAPAVVESFVDRVSTPANSDSNVDWRVAANSAVLDQVREQPLIGVGFGRPTEFWTYEYSSNGYRVPVLVQIEQDPHNGYMFLLAGGGIVTLASFFLIVGVFLLDALRRYRGALDDVERTVILWTVATLFAFLFNAASGTTFSSPVDLLTIWALLVLPAVVPLRRSGAAT
jgi:O-antigen ligase